jgi:hypothetical protein
MAAPAADPQSVLNGLTIVAAEQQTMNFYMTIGNRYQEPIARATYAEIGLIEEQHVSHYESILDPSGTWFENLVLHQWHECWMYWSAMNDETDARVRKLYERHLGMEIEHLRVACDLMRRVERRDPEEILPLIGFTEPLKFKPNIAYVRSVLASQIDLTAKDFDFVPVSTLPDSDRYFDYQKRVNDGWSPTEEVIRANKQKHGRDYRLELDGPNPVEGLRADAERNGASTDYARRQQAAA